MADFQERLAQRGYYLVSHAVPLQGTHRYSIVYQVEDVNGQVNLTNTHMLVLQQDTINYFLANASIDGSMVYRDAWVDREGFYICMYPAQGTLRRFISMDAQIGADEWFQIIFGIVKHLAPVHAVGIVHKDLKPSNVLVDVTLEENRITHAGVRITDYGIQIRSRIVGLPTPTLPGTLSYWSPEIRAGQAPTPASDMWALGCIAYEMCLGQPLFYGNNRAPIDNLVSTGVLDLSALEQRFGPRYAGAIRYIILWCLQVNRGNRASALDIRNYIQNIFRQEGEDFRFG